MSDDLPSGDWFAPRAPCSACIVFFALVLALGTAAGCSAPFSLPSGEELLPLRPGARQQSGAVRSHLGRPNLLPPVISRVLGTGSIGAHPEAVGLPAKPQQTAAHATAPERRPLYARGTRQPTDSAVVRTSAEASAEPAQPSTGISTGEMSGADNAAYGDLSVSTDTAATPDTAAAPDTAPSGDAAASGDLAGQAEVLPGDVAAGMATEGLVALTLDEALAYAESHHPLLDARRHEVAAAKGRFVTAGLLPNPELTMDSDVPVNEGRGADLRVRLMFTLPTAGKRKLREAVAAAEVARARWALKSETERVLLNAADAALEVLYLQELARLQGELSELATRRAQIERSRFEARTATFADAMEAEMDSSRLALQHKDTLDQLRGARWRLAQAIGLNPPQPVHVVGELPFEPFLPVPLDQVLASARVSRPELAEAEAALSESCRQLALARAEAKPDIGIGPRYEDHLGDGNDSMGARLDLDLPLFDRNQGAICENAAQTRARGAMVEAAEINTLGDVARAYVRLVSLQSRLNYYESQVTPVVERTHATLDSPDTRRALPADQASDLLQSLIQLRLDQLQLRYDYNRLRRRLEIFLGQRVDELALPAGAVLEQPAGALILPGEPSVSGEDATGPSVTPDVSVPSVAPDAAVPHTPPNASTPGLPVLPGNPGLVPPESAQPPRGGPMPEMMPLPGLREPAADPFELNDASEGPFELEPRTEGALEPGDSSDTPLVPAQPQALPGGAGG